MRDKPGLMGCILASVIALAACQASVAPSPSGPAGADGPEGLVAALQGAGVNSRLGARFSADPIAPQGVVLCVGTEAVQVYVFPSVAERVAAASKIDPLDPYHVGTAIVEWTGRPRFWQRDRLLILYLGEDLATEAALRATLGAPFASGQGGRGLLRDNSCALPAAS